jgi:uncharacterized membrane protein YgaE (UPF0421/DUF939 family)
VRRTSITLLPRIARRRLRGHLRPIVQTAVAAVTAWYLAALVGAEQRPVFASIAAVISLGATFGERRQKAVQLICGVVLGVAVADLLVRTIGTGLPQVGLLVLLAMLAAVLVGGGELLVSEAAVSAVLLASLPPSAAGTRITEALIGGGVALVVHALVFPPNPVLGVARAANAVFDEVGMALRNAGAALAGSDSRQAEGAQQAARTAEGYLRDLERALTVGEDTARAAPVRRPARAELARFRRTVDHLDLVIGETRLLVRDVLRLVRSGRSAPPELAEAVVDLARAVWEVPSQFEEPWRGGDVHVLALGAATRTSTIAERERDVLVREIAGHVRSVAIDIVRVSEAVDVDHASLTEAPTEELLLEVSRGAGRDGAAATRR